MSLSLQHLRPAMRTYLLRKRISSPTHSPSLNHNTAVADGSYSHTERHEEMRTVVHMRKDMSRPTPQLNERYNLRSNRCFKVCVKDYVPVHSLKILLSHRRPMSLGR
jgi:hypothetical protein